MDILKDPVLVHEVATSSFATWEELAYATASEKAQHLKPWAARLRLPPSPPPLAYPGSTVEFATRYEFDYPARLLHLYDPPPVISRRAHVPDIPLVAIAGPRWPSPLALEWAAAAAQAATDEGYGVVALLDDAAGQHALARGAAAGGQVIGVAGSDPARLVRHENLIQEITRSGGSIISEWHDTKDCELRLYRSSRLVAALARSVIVVEAGRHPSGGADLIRAAIDLDRPLATPSPTRPISETPIERIGSHLLTDITTITAFASHDHPYVQIRKSAGNGLADSIMSHSAMADWIAGQ